MAKTDGRDGAAPAGTPRDPGLLPRPAAPRGGVSDEQVAQLVRAADQLQQRYRSRGTTAGASRRLDRLDWAVRAGRLALADRAAATPCGPVGRARGCGSAQ